MMNEPCVHQSVYTDAFIAVAANSAEEALLMISCENSGWIIEDLRRLTPQIFPLDQPGIIFSHISGG
jgi:hypothetical protein